MTGDSRLMLFTGTANPELGREISRHLQVELGQVQLSRFADSEIYVRFLESVRGAHVFVIQSLCQPVNDSLMELLIMMDALKRASAGTVSAVIPYYGYSRQDKKTLAREAITAKLVADLLVVAGADRVLTMDLHAGQIQGYFDVPVDHLTALPILAEYFKGKDLKDVVVVSPDVGRVKTTKKLADAMNADMAVLSKRRPSHNVAEIGYVIGDVKGKNAIMVDDMIDTGGSVCRGVEALKKAGAKDIYVGCTHPILSGNAIDNLNLCQLKELVVTNTVPCSIDKHIDKMTVLSVGSVFAKTIRNVYENKSVSEIFGGHEHV
ncbi:MAG: ribose-phosphate pyrophosphokinase [Actinomycetota bacterium]